MRCHSPRADVSDDVIDRWIIDQCRLRDVDVKLGGERVAQVGHGERREPGRQQGLVEGQLVAERLDHRSPHDRFDI